MQGLVRSHRSGSSVGAPIARRTVSELDVRLCTRLPFTVSAVRTSRSRCTRLELEVRCHSKLEADMPSRSCGSGDNTMKKAEMEECLRLNIQSCLMRTSNECGNRAPKVLQPLSAAATSSPRSRTASIIIYSCLNAAGSNKWTRPKQGLRPSLTMMTRRLRFQCDGPDLISLACICSPLALCELSKRR